MQPLVFWTNNGDDFGGRKCRFTKQKNYGSNKSKEADNDTIRKLYGISIDKNSVHGSDSIANAKKEIDFFFKS